MGKRHLVGAVVAGHVGVICIAALIGGCAKERKKVDERSRWVLEEQRGGSGPGGMPLLHHLRLGEGLGVKA